MAILIGEHQLSVQRGCRIAGLSRASFDVQIVPFTWTHTNLPALHIGDQINLECDMVGKYVVRAVELMGIKV